MLANVRLIGFTARRLFARLFPCVRYARSANRPLSLTPGSSSHEATPLQSSNDFNRRSHTFRGEQPARVSALFATSLERVHLPRDLPRSRYGSALRLSQPLDGLHRASARGLVSSHSRVQGSRLFRGFSLYTATLPHQEESAPMPLKPHLLSGRNRLPQTKLLDFEAFIHAEVRASGLVLPAPSVDPLFRFCSFGRSIDGDDFSLPKAIRSWCSRTRLRVGSFAHLQRIVTNDSGSLFYGKPTRSSFLAFASDSEEPSALGPARK